LHILCANPHVTGDCIRAYLQLVPATAIIQKHAGKTGLHILCTNPFVTGEAIRVYLQLAPEAAKQEGSDGMTPFHYLGIAHKELRREGGVDQAIVHFQKAIEMAKKASNELLHLLAVLNLAECYIITGSIQEATDLHKSLVADIGKERLDSNYILSFTSALGKHQEFGHALEVLHENLDAIASTWEKTEQGKAYSLIGYTFFEMHDYNKSIVYYELQLSVAKEIKDLALESDALHGLGNNHGRVGDFEKSMMYLDQGLLALSELGNIFGQGRAYAAIGDALLAQDGHEKEAIEMFQKSYGILDTYDDPGEMSWTLCQLGEAYTRIEAWDDAITALEQSISITESIDFELDRNERQSQAYQVLGQTYIEQYCSDESLDGVPETRDEGIRKALVFSERSIEIRRGNDPSIYLDLAQEHYFLGDTEKAQVVLKKYLDLTVELGSSCCQACHQSCAKDETVMVCVGCLVTRYCSQAHQRRAWKKGRLCHKVMCPLLQRWRRLQKREYTTDSCNAIFNDFFESILVIKSVSTPRA